MHPNRHPDKGGSPEVFAELNRAREEVFSVYAL